MSIKYFLSESEWRDYTAFVEGLILQYCVKQICDVGGGANPVISLNFINQNQLDCTILDIS